MIRELIIIGAAAATWAALAVGVTILLVRAFRWAAARWRAWRRPDYPLSEEALERLKRSLREEEVRHLPPPTRVELRADTRAFVGGLEYAQDALRRATRAAAEEAEAQARRELPRQSPRYVRGGYAPTGDVEDLDPPPDTSWPPLDTSGPPS